MDKMRKNRDSLEIVVDILKAVSVHSSKTGIIEAANLHIYYANIYLEIALKAGFLVMSDHKYKITEKGKEFLQKHQFFFHQTNNQLHNRNLDVKLRQVLN